MKQEYKDFIFQIFHRPDHEMYEPDYYSWKYGYIESDNKIALMLDTKLLEIPFHDLLSNLMEWGLMITKLVISADTSDNESLIMEITEIKQIGQEKS